MTFSAAMPYAGRERLGFMAWLFIAILLITVFEGAFRKWVSNGLTYPLVGLRDVLAVVGIVYALSRGYERYAPQLSLSLLLASVLLVAWGLLQLLVNQSSPLVFLFGLRFWLLYLWFAVLAAVSMSEHDFRRIAQVMVLLLIGMAPLAVMQHFLPVESFWNKQVDEGYVFTVTQFIVRTTGTFSFTAGYTTFLAMTTPFALLAVDGRLRLWRGKWLPHLGMAALLVATVVSGSRGAIIFFGILACTYIGASVFFGNRRQKWRAIVLLIVLAVTLLAASLSIFSRAMEATRERFETASESESFIDRLAYNFLPQGESSLIGAGIGMGSNIGAVLETGNRQFLLAEAENARVILEGGVFGWLVLLGKLAVVLLGLRRAVYIARRTNSMLGVTLWMTTGLALLSWSIIGQLTINTLGYLLVGLAIAALRLEPNRTAR